jgi:hypothetical protein
MCNLELDVDDDKSIKNFQLIHNQVDCRLLQDEIISDLSLVVDLVSIKLKCIDDLWGMFPEH